MSLRLERVGKLIEAHPEGGLTFASIPGVPFSRAKEIPNREEHAPDRIIRCLSRHYAPPSESHLVAIVWPILYNTHGEVERLFQAFARALRSGAYYGVVDSIYSLLSHEWYRFAL